MRRTFICGGYPAAGKMELTCRGHLGTKTAPGQPVVRFYLWAESLRTVLYLILLLGVGVARVGIAGPEESAQAVLEAARHDVDVQVGHALAHLVVDGDECALRAQRLLDGARHVLGRLEERPHLLRR